MPGTSERHRSLRHPRAGLGSAEHEARVVAADATTLLAPRRMARRLAGLGAVVVVAAVLIATLPGLGTLRSSFAGAKPEWIVAALLLQIGSVASFVPAFRGAFARRIPWRPSTSMAMTVQGANVLLPAAGPGAWRSAASS